MGHVIRIVFCFIEILHFVPDHRGIVDKQLGFHRRNRLNVSNVKSSLQTNTVPAVCIQTCLSTAHISVLVLLWLTWLLGTWLAVMVGSVEAMKALRVVATTLALVKPPRPFGRTVLIVNAFKLEVSFPRAWYLHQRSTEETHRHTERRETYPSEDSHYGCSPDPNTTSQLLNRLSAFHHSNPVIGLFPHRFNMFVCVCALISTL